MKLKSDGTGLNSQSQGYPHRIKSEFWQRIILWPEVEEFITRLTRVPIESRGPRGFVLKDSSRGQEKTEVCIKVFCFSQLSFQNSLSLKFTPDFHLPHHCPQPQVIICHLLIHRENRTTWGRNPSILCPHYPQVFNWVFPTAWTNRLSLHQPPPDVHLHHHWHYSGWCYCRSPYPKDTCKTSSPLAFPWHRVLPLTIPSLSTLLVSGSPDVQFSWHLPSLLNVYL